MEKICWQLFNCQLEFYAMAPSHSHVVSNIHDEEEEEEEEEKCCHVIKMVFH